MELLALLLSLGTFALVLAEDVFLFPPNFGQVGEYVSNLNFTVGQNLPLSWKSTAGGQLSLWLFQDSDQGVCALQSKANCALIAGTFSLTKTF